MKKFFYIVFALTVLSCDDKPEKPAHLLSEDEMANIIYDASLLQAIRSYQPNYLRDNGVSVNKYIYEKYKIDSATFAENHLYYANDLEAYERIHDKVSARVNKERDPLKDKTDSIRENPKNLSPQELRRQLREKNEKASKE